MRSLLTAGIFLVLLGTSSQAGFLIETASTTGTTDYTHTLSVANFDSSLGKLLDVVISYADNTMVSGTLTNTSNKASNFTLTQTTNFGLSLGGTSLLTNSLTTSELFTNLASNAMATLNTTPQSGGSGPLFLTSGSLFNGFLATGQTNFSFATLTNTLVVGGGGNDILKIMTTADATVTVRFDYTDKLSSPMVPEPSSVILMGMGLGVLALGKMGSQRRKRCDPIAQG